MMSCHLLSSFQGTILRDSSLKTKQNQKRLRLLNEVPKYFIFP